ncbi:hypothetical protein J4450_03315 [Candidatus Micrarchaeota archaeon]|nr:hypothetical protein [Candidatus Micrarchaeota archaeon]
MKNLRINDLRPRPRTSNPLANLGIRIVLAVSPFAACAAPMTEGPKSSISAKAPKQEEKPDPEIDPLIKDLQSPDKDTRFGGAWELMKKTEQGKKGERIKKAIPALVRTLSDEDNIVASNAARAIANFAVKEDVSQFVKDIEAALEKCPEAAWPLIWHYAKNGKWTDVERLVRHPNREARGWGVRELGDVAGEGIDISPILDILDSLLHDHSVEKTPEGDLRKYDKLNIGEALVGALKNEKTRDNAFGILINALQQGDEFTRFNAAFALKEAVKDGVVIPKMKEELTRAIEAESKRDVDDSSGDAIQVLDKALRMLERRE